MLNNRNNSNEFAEPKDSLMVKIASLLVSIPAFLAIIAVLLQIIGLGSISDGIAIVLLYLGIIWIPLVVIGAIYLSLKKFKFIKSNNLPYIELFKNSKIVIIYMVAIIVLIISFVFQL